LRSTEKGKIERNCDRAAEGATTVFLKLCMFLKERGSRSEKTYSGDNKRGEERGFERAPRGEQIGKKNLFLNQRND